MSKILKGKNLMVKIAGTIYGFATSCDIDITVDTKEISSGSYKHSTAKGQWKEYDSERTGWTINTDHLATVNLVDEKVLYAAMINGDAIKVSFEQIDVKSTLTNAQISGETGTLESETPRLGFEGDAIITSLKISASSDSDATYSVSLQGTGELKVIA